MRLIRSDGGTAAADSPSRVTYIKSEEVEASFAKGVAGQLYDGKAEGENWALNTDDREEPGPALSHAHTTEINIIVAGTATYVVGGSIMNPGKGVYAEDTSGTAIQGGETYHLSKGDVIIVPQGVPHWFKEAHGFRYFLIRIHHSEREVRLSRHPNATSDESVDSAELEKTTHPLKGPHRRSRVEVNPLRASLTVQALPILEHVNEEKQNAVDLRPLGARF